MRPEDIRGELERHHQAAFGWALSCCTWDRTAAEDVLQTSYLKVLDGRARFEGRSSFKTWLFAVIRRTAGEHRRRQLRRRMLPLWSTNGRPEMGNEQGAHEALVRSESSARLVGALRALPRRQQEILHLVFYQDLTIAGAAGALGIAVGTARTHYERGKRRLRELLAGEKEHVARRPRR
jgi:RNA polymerase sigma-70 factor (ECF subfamily)